MRVASVVLRRDEYMEITSFEVLAMKVEKWLEACREDSIEVVVFPALLGCLFDDWESYINEIIEKSSNYKEMAICPGSCHEKHSGETYHTSWVVRNGNVLIKQRQIYLAKWEKAMGLSQGVELESCYLEGIKLGVMVSTDMFYPQVSRALAMSGVELVLAPAAVVGGENAARQLSGLWQNVQGNLFFGVESGYKGRFMGQEFCSTSMIHAPLEMTESFNGILAREDKRMEKSIITADIDNIMRKAAVKKFDTLSQLNPEAYKDIFRDFTGGG